MQEWNCATLKIERGNEVPYYLAGTQYITAKVAECERATGSMHPHLPMLGLTLLHHDWK